MNTSDSLRHAAFSMIVVGQLVGCGSGSSSPTTPPPPPPPPIQTVHDICATVLSTNGSGDDGNPIGDVDCAGGWSNGPPISTCLATPRCAGTNARGAAFDSPYVITMSIVSGFATPLTATLVNCPLGNQNQQRSPCVAATNESAAAPFAVKLTFGQPNGNAGPSTTLVLQQTGTSALSGAECNHTTWADATDILVADSYGNKVYLPIGSTLDGSGCPNGTT